MDTGLYRNHSHRDFNDQEFDLTRSRRKDRDHNRKRDGEERDYLNRSYNPGKVSTGFQESERGDFLSFTKKRKLSPILQNQYHSDGTKSRFVKKVQQPSELESPFDAKVSVQRWSDDREPGELDVEEDEAPLAANIATSRWADVKDEEETVLNSRSTDSSDLTESRSGENALTTELYGGTYVDEDYMDVDEKKFRTGESREQTLSPQQTTNMLQESRSIDEFWGMKKISEGTYGVVYSARDRKTGEKVALKKVKMEKEREGFPLTSLREINIMLSLQHPSIVGVKEVVTSEDLNGIFMVMEYMDNDLKGLMDTMKQPFCQSKVKCLMLQLLKGVDYLHDNWVLHRDLKTANLLLNSHDELKICDFGLSRQFGSQSKLYTQLVVTLWYRAPELLLGAKEYSTAIDMWSVGCIMAELLAKEPLFNGKSEVDQLHKIIRILGTPNEKIWPGFTKLPGGKVNFVKQPHNKLRDKFPPTNFFSGRPTLSEAGFDLLSKLLTYDPEQRITAKSAISHPWFRVCIGCTTTLMEEGFVPVFLLV